MDELVRIPIGQVLVPQDTLRKDINQEALGDLAASIKVMGLLQPIVVKREGRNYRLIAGLRRTLACRLIGERFMLARVVPDDFEVDTVAALVENIQRADLSLTDEAQAVRRLVDEYGVGIPETARRLGKGQGWVRSRLDILKLPNSILEPLRGGQLSLGVALELNKIRDPEIRDTYVGYAVDGGCTNSQAVRWRQQLEIDLAAGYLVPGEDLDLEPASPRQETLIRCAVCIGEFPLKLSQIMHVCAHCYWELLRLQEDSSHGRDDRRPDPATDQPDPERTAGDGLGDRGNGHPGQRYPADH